MAFFKQLSELLRSYNIELKIGKGYFKGGGCRINDRRILYLNRTENLNNQIDIVLTELGHFDIDAQKLRPEIEALLENSREN